MFSTARRHATPKQDRQEKIQQDQPQQLNAKKSRPVALSAPPTPSNGHAHGQTPAQAYAAAAQARPATAAPAVPATFSRATGRSHATSSALAAAASVRPVTASGGFATFLPPSVPQTFPTPAPSPSPSPSPSPYPLSVPGQSAPALNLAMPRASASACVTPSPLSSGLPSPTLPPLPSSHFPSQHSHHPALPSPHVRSPVINIATSSAGSALGSPRIVHHHHARKLSIGKDEFDYRVHHHHVRPTHIRKYSVSSECDSVPSPKSMKPPNSPSDPSSPASQGSGSSMREDVLSPGDRVGAGLMLQGEVLRPVFDGNETTRRDKEEPAAELEVVRRLGAGSYAIVYLVREVLHHPPPGILGGLDKVDRRNLRKRNSDKLDDMELWDDLDSDTLELDGVPRKEDDRDDANKEKVYYGKEYAVKVLSKAGMDEEAIDSQLAEANIHQTLPIHSNIVTLHRALETPSFLFLVLEFVPGEDLYYFLEQARDHYEPEPLSSGSASSESEGEDRGHKSNTSVLSVNSVGTTRTPPTPSLLSTLNEKQLLGRRRLRLIASMFSQMCEAVAVCHDVGVYHRDIKPENFIVTDGWEDDGERRVVVVKLTDFGLSTRDAASSDMDCGSAPYMSYECRNNCAPTYAPRAADVWSLGIVLINMLYHINPWTDTTQGVCPSFSTFLAAPEHFFMQRFAGMNHSVASFLCQRVFCILPSNDPSDRAGRRASAREFGRWAKDLPRLMASEEPVGVPPALALANLSSATEVGEKNVPVSNFAFPAPVPASPKEAEKDLVMVSPTSPSSTLLAQSLAAVLAQQEAAAAAGSSSPAWRHKRGLSNASVGYALSSVPQSRRPASRKQSFSAERGPPHLGLPGLGSAAGSRAATPLLRGRVLGGGAASTGVGAGPWSRVPSCSETPAGIIGVSELPTVFDEGEGDISNGSLGLELGGESQLEPEESVLDVEHELPQEIELEVDHEHDHEPDHEQEQEHDVEDENSTMSRSTSMVRRRKRGARRGKGQIIQQQQLEIARLQQQQEELTRQVQIMAEQLAKQQQQRPAQSQAQAQVQVLSSLNPVSSVTSVPTSNSATTTTTSSLLSAPISLVSQNSAVGTRTDDVLDSLASASEALARELSRTRNARGVSSPSPTLSHAQSLSHLQASGNVSAPGGVPVPIPMRAISSASLGAGTTKTRDNSPTRSSVSASLSVAHAHGGVPGGSMRSANVNTNSTISPSAAMALSGAGGPTPGAMFPVSFASTTTRTSSGGSATATRHSQQTASSSASGKSSLGVEPHTSSSTVSTPSNTTTTPTTAAAAAAVPAPAPAIAKKTSKWKLSFGKGSSTSTHSRTPLPQTQTPVEAVVDVSAVADGKDGVDSVKGKGKDAVGDDDSADAHARQSPELGQSGGSSAQHGTAKAISNSGAGADVGRENVRENVNEPWSRGRRLTGNQQQQHHPWNTSTDRRPNVERDRERNVSPNSTRTGRSGSGHGHLSALSSSASSLSSSSNSNSNNWRHSTLTTSSATSGWTRYSSSNASMRSVSTVATSVSGASASAGSWRNASNASLGSVDKKGQGIYGGGGGSGGPPSIASRKSDKSSLSGMPPPNVKIMTGVPWALDELPRQLHPNPSGDIFGMPPSARKQRVRKPKDLPTISERPGNTNANTNLLNNPHSPHHLHASSPFHHNNNNNGNNINNNKPTNKSPLSQRVDATRSSTSLSKYSGEGLGLGGGDDGVRDVVEDVVEKEKERMEGAPRKVQKGQINALAKMLSALRR